ncbi:hypothetical protein L21SP2_1480 [Salinispira pacifica]|uniref:HTH cro/C1-type domain-containing protein n=1 Tax=Salinispira pacifica TaxID=1307761 RepID=V5WGB2_9SPIO|nr:hypothetical protein L21SP2_1480 [Salinispira pacifica]
MRLSDEMIIRLSVALGISSDQLLGLTEIEQTHSHLSLRITRRMRELDRLPENKKKTILQVLDDLIRANS